MEKLKNRKGGGRNSLCLKGHTGNGCSTGVGVARKTEAAAEGERVEIKLRLGAVLQEETNQVLIMT